MRNRIINQPTRPIDNSEIEATVKKLGVKDKSAPKRNSSSAERKKKALATLDDKIEKTKLNVDAEASGWDDNQDGDLEGDLDFADLEISFDEAINLSMKTNGR